MVVWIEGRLRDRSNGLITALVAWKGVLLLGMMTTCPKGIGKFAFLAAHRFYVTSLRHLGTAMASVEFPFFHSFILRRSAIQKPTMPSIWMRAKRHCCNLGGCGRDHWIWLAAGRY